MDVDADKLTRSDLIPLVSTTRHALDQRRMDSPHATLFELLDAVRDPELPVISIWELGILQDVTIQGDTVRVILTPTYSGCPAMGQIESDVRRTLGDAGYADIEVVTRLAPAWSTDWMAPGAQRRLREYGVAAPQDLRCPNCDAEAVELISEFSATACKAFYRCTACEEPFDWFKAF